MRLFFYLLLVFVSNHLLLSGQSKPEYYDSLFAHYKILNDTEVRLMDYKDDDTALMQKIIQLELINNNRKKYRAAPVQLDILASRLANKNSREAAENGYTSHWNLNGETPYQRYAKAGGLDHISENAFGQSTNKKYEMNRRTINELMHEGHSSFMAEKNPYDGHKQNITDKHHNYVGIGFYMTEKQFNYYEEFIDRYLLFEDIPSEVIIKKEFTIKVSVPIDQYLFFTTVSMDNFPHTMNTSILNRTGTYNDFGSRNISTIEPWELSKMRQDKIYHLKFTFNKAGLYYIHCYLNNKELLRPGSYNTKGKIQASGLVIRVNE